MSIEAYDSEKAKAHANPKCIVCYGGGTYTHFLHGKKGKYSHTRACPCAITGYYDAVKAELENATENSAEQQVTECPSSQAKAETQAAGPK